MAFIPFGYRRAIKAVENNDAATLAKLLDKGLDVNAAPGFMSMTLLCRAFLCGHDDIALLLLQRGATLNMFEKSGSYEDNMALGVIARLDILKTAFEKFPTLEREINKKREKHTLLSAAAHDGQADVVRFLLEKGAMPDIKCKDGETALEMARRKGHESVVAVLEEFAQRGREAAYAAESGWKKLSDMEIAHVRVETAIGYRLTDIYNFAAQTVTRLSASLATGQEAIAAPQPFGDIADKGPLSAALDALQQQGGRATPADLNALRKGASAAFRAG
jgi:hypothetical protein